MHAFCFVLIFSSEIEFIQILDHRTNFRKESPKHVQTHLSRDGRQSTISSLIDLQHSERMCTPMQLDSSFSF